jgi:hypothetical protein
VSQSFLPNNSRVAGAATDAVLESSRSSEGDALEMTLPALSRGASARASCEGFITTSAAWHERGTHAANRMVETACLCGLAMVFATPKIVMRLAFIETKVILQRFTFPRETWRYVPFHAEDELGS